MASIVTKNVDPATVPTPADGKTAFGTNLSNQLFIKDDDGAVTVITGDGTWGSIGGTLSAQTDLQSALDLKAPLASPTFTGTVTVPATIRRGGANAVINLTSESATTFTNRVLPGADSATSSSRVQLYGGNNVLAANYLQLRTTGNLDSTTPSRIQWGKLSGGVDTANNLPLEVYTVNADGFVLVGSFPTSDTPTENVNFVRKDYVDPRSQPAGGTSGQVLTKNSEDDFDSSWQNPAGVPVGGTTRQVLAKLSDDDFDTGWAQPFVVHGDGTADAVVQPLNVNTANIQDPPPAPYGKSEFQMISAPAGNERTRLFFLTESFDNGLGSVSHNTRFAYEEFNASNAFQNPKGNFSIDMGGELYQYSSVALTNTQNIEFRAAQNIVFGPTNDGNPDAVGNIIINSPDTPIMLGADFAVENITDDRHLTTKKYVDDRVAPAYEEFVATAAQTVFETTMETKAKAAGKAYLQVFVNGVLQMEGKTWDVTDTNEITFATGLAEDDDVAIFGFGV